MNDDPSLQVVLTVQRVLTLPCWRLIKHEYISIDHPCNNAGTNCYFTVLDESGNYLEGVDLLWESLYTRDILTTGPYGSVGYCYENGEEVQYGVSVAMGAEASFAPGRGETGPLDAAVFHQYPSDELQGMGLPLRRHVQFTATWQLILSGELPPDPPPLTEKEWYIARQKPGKLVLRERVKVPLLMFSPGRDSLVP